MAKTILRDAVITVNGVPLSDHANKLTITSSKDVQDVTAFGAQSKQKALGLGDGTIAIDLFQDFDAGSVDATLWPIHTGNSEVVITAKATSASVSATNPLYTMTGILPEYTPIDGSVGDASKVSVTFQNSGAAGIVRTTS